MKKVAITTLLIFCLFSISISQPMPELGPKKEAMSKLSNLIGKWEGSGWASSQDGSRNEFIQSEEIEMKLDGIALLIMGIGKDKNTGNTGHNALGVITYDENGKEYIIQSHLATGQSTTAKGYFEDGKFIWGFEVPGGQIKYTISTDQSNWNEYGEFSRDGNQWYKFIEMNLKKVSEN